MCVIRAELCAANAAKRGEVESRSADAALPRYPIYFLLLSAIARFCPTGEQIIIACVDTLA